MERLARTLLVTAALAAAALAAVMGTNPAAAQDAGDLVVERFDASLDVRADGTVRVVEDLTVDFGEAEHHGIVRFVDVRTELAEDTQVQLPEGREPADYWRVIELDEIDVTSSAHDAVEITREAGTVELRIGDPDRTVTGRHTYEIAYTVEGALNAFEDRAELTWDVTGFEWDNPILATTATVEAPAVLAAACYRGPEGSTSPCERAEIVDGEAHFATGRLAPGENLTVSVGFPLDAVEVPPPLLEERWRVSRALTGDPAVVPLTAATTVLGLAAIALAARGWPLRSTDARSASGAEAYEGDPPQGLRPAELRLLLHERADATGLAATVFHLGARGHLKIQPADAHNADRADHWVSREDGQDDALADFERRLLERLFADGDVVQPDKLRKTLDDELPAFRDRLESDAMERGWLTERPSQVRSRRAALQIGLLVAAAAILALALAVTTVALAAIPLVVAAAVLAVLAQRRTGRTPEGERLAEQAGQFHAYLSAGDPAGGAPQSGDVAAPSQRFGAYLPFALALEALPDWVERYKRSSLPVQQWAPAYYLYPYGAMDRDDTFVPSVQGFGSQSTSTASATSMSSGGGASGGGVGGGGGGGW